MAGCQDIEPLLCAYVDRAASAEERAAVDAHLATCVPCRARVSAQRGARQLLRDRAARLRIAAPPPLHARCRLIAANQRPRAVFLRRHPVLAAVAATLVLVVAGLGGYATMVSADERIAAELAFDHVKCFTLARGGGHAVNASDVQANLREACGWSVRVPVGAETGDLQLIGGRRCFSEAGALAHMLYRRSGRAVSLFVLPRPLQRNQDYVRVMGYSAMMWSRGGRSYVLVARATPRDMVQMAGYFRKAAY